MATDDVSEAEVYAPDSRSPALPWSWRLVAAGAMLVALALLAAVLAYWGWRWFGPAPALLPPAGAEGDPLRPIAEAHLFGAAPLAPASEPSLASGDLRLLGVFARRDGQGYALFRVALSTAAPRTAQCAAPAGFAGQVLRLNAELLSGMITAPDTWKALVQPGPGGVIVRDQSGFAGMMGLRNGDRVERANGVALALPEDIATTVLRPLTRSQTVWVSGSREGRPQQWLYLNAGACPG